MAKLKVQLVPLAIIVILLIIIGAMFYTLTEGWTMVDSLYFTVMTLTTIGFGDLHPTTNISKLFTVVYVLGGVYILFYALRVITTHYIEKTTPNIRRSVTQTLEHMVKKKKRRGDVVIKLKPQNTEDKKEEGKG